MPLRWHDLVQRYVLEASLVQSMYSSHLEDVHQQVILVLEHVYWKKMKLH